MRFTAVLPLTALLLALPCGAHAEDSSKNAQPQDPQLGALLLRLDVILSAPELKAGVKEGDQADDPFVWWTEGTKENVPEEFKWIDSNGNNDGHLKRAEVRASEEKVLALLKETMPDQFAKIDANGDGKLSRDEVQAARKKLEAADKGGK